MRLRLPFVALLALLPLVAFAAAAIVLVDRQQERSVEELIRHATDAALAALDAFRTFDASKSDFIRYNRAFHVAVAMCSPHRRMREEVVDLVAQADRLVLVSIGATQGRDPDRLIAEHVAIIEALQSRDGRKAARLLRDHIADAEKRVVAALSRHAVVL